MLNSEQYSAVEHLDGPLLVLAGAGSGKTRIVTQRIANLIDKGIPPSQILAVTFTNKAAKEMAERVRAITQSAVLISTFHSLGLRILRESVGLLAYSPDFIIYDTDDADRLIRTILKSEEISEKELPSKRVKEFISRAKNELKSPDEVSVDGKGDESDKHLPRLYGIYQRKLQEFNAMDFDDLLYQCVKLFKEFPQELEKFQKRWQYVLIDEYQDTNGAQYQMVKYLVGRHHNLLVVGDPDQSIYSWRGADLKNILSFEKDYPGARVVRLEQNYRSYNTILKAANSLILHNFERYEKNLWSARGEGGKVRVFIGSTEYEEVEYVVQEILRKSREEKIPFNEMVVFYRTNFQSRVFEDVLLRARIPYTIVGGISFYQRKEIKDILGFLRLLISDQDYISFVRTINIPKRGIGPSSIDKIEEASSAQGMSILGYCRHLIATGFTDMRLGAKQREGLTQYITLIDTLRGMKKEYTLSGVISAVVEHSRYLSELQEDPTTYDDRKQNIEELIAKAVEWEAEGAGTLEQFLEELTLKANIDEWGEDEQRLNLMTLHNGKGLEFQVAFLVGMEETLFPHVNSLLKRETIEEERRLCYVGMTRAKDHLYLTGSRQRYLWGGARRMNPSRFIQEIDPAYIERASRLAPVREEYIESNEIEAEFGIGDEVVHKDFGRGTIQNVRSSSLGLIYDVRFQKDSQVKTLVAQYAKLTV